MFRHTNPYCAGRGGHGHFGAGGGRPGFFGGPFGGGFRGGGGMRTARVLGSGDLQLLILLLLSEKPRHGYEIIKAIEEHSSGVYTPSPGMVYPALTYLEELGHATVAAEGAKKLYSITASGLSDLESNRAAVDAILEQLAWIGGKMDHVRRALSGREGADSEDFDMPGAGGRAHRVALEIRQARRNLKSALIEKYGAPAAEQRRIAQILERAAEEIRSPSTPAAPPAST